MNRITVITLDMIFYLTFLNFEYRKLDVSNIIIYVHIKYLNIIGGGDRKRNSRGKKNLKVVVT